MGSDVRRYTISKTTRQHLERNLFTALFTAFFYEPGRQGEWWRAITIFEFEDGWQGRVTYYVTRDQQGWKLDESFTDRRNDLGDGPW